VYYQAGVGVLQSEVCVDLCLHGSVCAQVVGVLCVRVSRYVMCLPLS
jgi:hypothetical protein